jgi:O-antigen ligase
VHSKKYRPLVLFSSVSFILILIWTIEIFTKKFFMAYIRAENIPVLGGRLYIWPVALELIAEKPIFGYGFGTEEYLFILKKHTMMGFQVYLTHNSYLGMTLQLGILGFILLFVPLFILLFKELFSRQTNETVPPLRYALRATLIAGLICAFYESWIYSVGNAQAFPYWITVMLLVYYRYQEKSALEST